MKKINIIISAGLFLLVSVFFGCNQKSEQQTDSHMVSKEISITEAKAKLTEGKYIFIDLRTPEEIEESGKVKGAIEMNFRDSDFNSKFAALDKDKPYVVYCAGGGRSGKTLKLAKELGFTEVYDMTEGFSQWGE